VHLIDRHLIVKHHLVNSDTVVLKLWRILLNYRCVPGEKVGRVLEK
jgi:hypothetical protein